jgi:Flp pilus assembly pilin Flp
MTNSDTIARIAGRRLARLWADESGATAIEYAMIASGIGAAVAATVYLLADKVKALFLQVSALFT